ncbi:hypothetical protein FB451DRAFT_1395993 [Mycena latifolia]|nr:hypothetical protein FB451DRAFT_1395993 [Mycena latifolia]
MDEGINPLAIQELLDHCIGFLHRPSDLKACALVARAWVDAAQVQLFREVYLTSRSNERRWSLLQETLEAFPRFIRHIRRLEIYSVQLSGDTFSAICQFPFTHVEHVFVGYPRDLESSGAVQAQQLLSLPTLRRVHLQCEFMDSSAFLCLWDRCSSGIRHLHLEAFQRVYEPIGEMLNKSSPPIFLESLRVAYAQCVGDWISHDLCPFDLSRLKVLSIDDNLDLLRSPKFATSFRTLETLDIQLESDTDSDAIELSSFPSLAILRICCNAPNPLPMVLPILCSITPTSRINKIIFATSFTRGELEELDATLCALPMSHPAVVELEMHPIGYTSAAKSLSQLSSQDLLRRADYNPRWFDVQET